MDDRVGAFLEQVPLFEDHTADELMEFAAIAERRALAAGEVVFEEGEPGDGFYVVTAGRVEVVKGLGSDERVVVSLETPAIFGEMALLDGAPRSATVRARGPAEVLWFPRQSFARLLREERLSAYRMIHQMARVLVSRQRQTTARLVRLIGAAEAAGVAEDLGAFVHWSAVAE